MKKFLKILLIILFILFVSLNYKQNISKTNITHKKEHFDISCNNKTNNGSKLIDKHLEYINTNTLHKAIYTNTNLIPYNFTDFLDNNLVYRLNTKKKEKILHNEKKIYNKIKPFNTRILTKEFNKNLDINKIYKPNIYEKCEQNHI